MANRNLKRLPSYKTKVNAQFRIDKKPYRLLKEKAFVRRMSVNYLLTKIVYGWLKNDIKKQKAKKESEKGYESY